MNPSELKATQEATRLTGRGRDIAGETREAIQRLSVVVGETGLTVTQLAFPNSLSNRC